MSKQLTTNSSCQHVLRNDDAHGEPARTRDRLTLLGAMAGNLAHDFNNVLVALSGFTGLAQAMLRPQVGQERVLAYLAEVEAAGERARLLVQQLSTLVQSGPCERSRTLLGPLADAVTARHARSCPDSITLRCDLADDLPALAMAPVHVDRVLSNLCRNAREAIAESGTIVISAQVVSLLAGERCSSCQHELAGNWLRIAVADDGCGIPGHLRQRVCEPFFTTAPAGTRAGLGLTVVDGLTHFYGGHLQIGGRREQGCEISLYFPLAP